MYVAALDENNNKIWLRNPLYKEASLQIRFDETSPMVVVPIGPEFYAMSECREVAEDFLDRLCIPWAWANRNETVRHTILVGDSHQNCMFIPFRLTGPLVGEIVKKLKHTCTSTIEGDYVVTYGGF